MNDLIPIQIPMENVNDVRVILVQWLVEDGQEVRPDQPIAEVETSKAIVELIAPCRGVIEIKAQPGREVEVGAIVGYVKSNANIAAAQNASAAGDRAITQSTPNHTDQHGPPVSASLPCVRFSRKAQELIDQHGLAIELFASQTMVREGDVRTLLEEIRSAAAQRDDLHFAVRGISLAGITLPSGVDADRGSLDPHFLDSIRENRAAFGRLSSAERCEQYRRHGAVIGDNVVLGNGTVILSPQLVLEDGVRIGDDGNVDCSERFIAGRLSSFRDGLSIQGGTVVLGENVFACRRIEISSGAGNPWSVLYVGDNTFIGDDVLLDISRPIVIGKEVFLTQRSIVITHNIGHSILEGYENRFEAVVLEDRSQVGMSSTLYAGSRIGSAAIVASNSYVISSIPADKLAIGVPARIVRDARRLPSREQQVQIAKQMVRDLHEMLILKQLDVSPVERDSFTLKYDGKRFQLAFTETYSNNEISADADADATDQTVIWTLEASATPPPGCALVDLLRKTIEGEGGIFADTTREFLRKRGIRCEPGPWRYRQGLI